MIEITEKISERFALEWETFRDIVPLYEEHLATWVSPLTPEQFKNKEVLDAGCGMGRNPYFFLKWGANFVTAIDVNPRTLRTASTTLKAFNNCKVQQLSIYDIPYVSKFDIVTCIGVLHHLSDDNLAIKKLLQAAKPNGKILLWVYAKEGNEFILKVLHPLRLLMRKLSSSTVANISLIPSLILKLYLNLAKPNQPYYKLIQGYSFRQIQLIVHDQLVPLISRYYTKQELETLIKSNCRYKFEIVHSNQMSYSILIHKE